MSRSTHKLILVLSLICQSLTLGGDKQGNGGDHVRSVFLRVGGAVIKFVKTTPAGQALIARGISTDRLQATLSIHRITVEEKPLYDPKGALTPSLANPGWIKLHGPSWLVYFDRQDDVYFEAFHLMLVSAGYTDDGHVLSGALYPFPITLRVSTRTAAQTGPENSQEMPYPERRRHLIERCDKLAARSGGPAELRLITGLQLQILEQTPTRLPEGADPARYQALLDSFERKLNDHEAAYPQKENR